MKECLYEGVSILRSNCTKIVLGRKVNVIEMECFKSLVGVSPMDRVRNKEVRRRAGLERVLTSIEMVRTRGDNG